MAIKFLHTRFRVSDLDRSIEWYCRHCGFEVFKRNDKSPFTFASRGMSTCSS